MNHRLELGVLALSLALALSIGAMGGCGDDDGASSSGEGESTDPGTGPRRTTTPPGADGPVVTEESEIDRLFPLYGAVTGTRIRIFSEASEEAPVVGWLRTGAKIRLSGDTQRGPECRAGYAQVWPTGWVCTAEGIESREADVDIETPTLEGWKEDQTEEAASRGALVLPPGPRDQPLPYDYYFVKETTVPEYHRLPSRNEQRAALAFAAHYEELLGFNERRAAAYLGGETGNGPTGTAIAARYLDRGFMIAGSGVELRASRRFVRTTGGRFIKQSQLEERNGSDFHGVELGEEVQLPVAWALRTGRPWRQREADDGTVSFHEDSDAEPIERQTFLDGWTGQRNMGGQVMHDIGGDRYLRAWFATVAERIDRPDEVGADEPWVHIDLSAQTLVLYQGDEALFATLISSGIEDNETPIGIFEIQNKHITTTMANIGPDADSDRYRIEDVPWTQYFDGSIALHAAFWHTRFGMPRSHGCINMAPADAHRVFGATWPEVPESWHGISTDQTPFRGSHVVVTE
ncbi:MAG: hypothetical protein DRJ42_25735 [Deltaproteobacteria bacterium]|nr:MAG: hypothetical protein DRJ42_25735 [Deltaproteobacteria bacterium]